MDVNELLTQEWNFYSKDSFPLYERDIMFKYEKL